MACHLQETGQVEYRIDHLLKEMGVEVRRRETPAEPATSAARKRKMYRGELTRDLQTRTAQFMKPGEPMDWHAIATRLSEVVDYEVNATSVYLYCHSHPEVFEKRYERDRHGQRRACFMLKAPAAAP